MNEPLQIYAVDLNPKQNHSLPSSDTGVSSTNIIVYFQVYSGFRFIQRAVEQGKEIAIVNIGPTRGDKLANLKIDARCGEILPLINLDGLLT